MLKLCVFVCFPSFLSQVQLQSKKKLRREEEEKVVEEEEDYRDPLTASGQKKRLSAIMPKNYNPSNVEKW